MTDSRQDLLRQAIRARGEARYLAGRLREMAGDDAELMELIEEGEQLADRMMEVTLRQRRPD